MRAGRSYWCEEETMLDINLKQLEVFVAAAEYGNFTRAADVL